MIVRKTLKQANAEGGYIDREKFDSFTDADIERMIDEDLGSLLEGLESWGESQPYDSDEASTVRVALRHWRKARRVPTELAAELAGAESRAEHAWVEARAASDFRRKLPRKAGA